MRLDQLIDAATAARPADLVVTGGRLVNVFTGEIYPADVAVAGDRIVAVGAVDRYRGADTEQVDAAGGYVVPGLVDGHLHIECSKLSVTMFADAVVRCGTTSVVSGLDQMCVVAGLDGARSALDEAAASPLRVFWGAPFQTPYTLPRSTVGHYLGPAEHRVAQAWPECVGVWETVSEFVLGRDPAVLETLELARRNRLPAFGCAPMAAEATLPALCVAGIRLDHESYSAAEALAKLRAGMYFLVRESSVAHFLEENIKVVTELGADPSRVAFCTDDVTVSDMLEHGHIDHLVRLAIAAGVPPVTAVQMATINCAQMYRIDHLVGSVAPGKYADLLVAGDLQAFDVRQVVAGGRLVAAGGQMLTAPTPPVRDPALLHTMRRAPVRQDQIAVRAPAGAPSVRVLAMDLDRQVPFVRRRRDVVLAAVDGVLPPSVAQDVLYVCVVERYGNETPIRTAFVTGFELRTGALATSAAPDDNNIVCVGTNAADMAVAVNQVLATGGGLAVAAEGTVREFLALPVGGIVADLPAEQMAEAERRLDAAAGELGCRLPSAFGYLMFLAITAIPDYAVTDGGLVDYHAQQHVDPLLDVAKEATP
ncbi:MAG: amidohydrolase family protein [Streptosporangiales bacterium]|nr:amidohydrolase family protein [Streptosporangiales bacterium]